MDAAGEVVTGVDLDPGVVHVTIPVYTNLENRTVPVNPIVTGTPGAGSGSRPWTSIRSWCPSRATRTSSRPSWRPTRRRCRSPGRRATSPAEVAFALPTGVSVIGDQTATVTVRIEPVTETRTFTAGIRLDGRQAGLQYDASETSVLLTLYGSTADLDRLDASPIVISLNVAALEPGTTEVPVVPVAAVCRDRGRDLARDRHGDGGRAPVADAGPGAPHRAESGVTVAVGRAVGFSLTRAAPTPKHEDPA